MLRVRHLLRNEFRMQRRGYDTTLALDEDIHSASTIECPGPPSTCDISRYFDHPMDSSVSFDSAARCCGTHVTSGQDCTFCWLQLIRFCHLSQPFLLPASPLQHLWRLLLAWLLLVQCLRHLDLYSIYTGFELPFLPGLSFAIVYSSATCRLRTQHGRTLLPALPMRSQKSATAMWQILWTTQSMQLRQS